MSERVTDFEERRAKARGIGRSKEERAQVDELILKRKRADPDLTPLALARRFGVAVERARLVLRAAGLYPTPGRRHE